MFQPTQASKHYKLYFLKLFVVGEEFFWKKD